MKRSGTDQKQRAGRPADSTSSRPTLVLKEVTGNRRTHRLGGPLKRSCRRTVRQVPLIATLALTCTPSSLPGGKRILMEEKSPLLSTASTCPWPCTMPACKHFLAENSSA